MDHASFFSEATLFEIGVCVTRAYFTKTHKYRKCHVHHTRHTPIFLFVPSLLFELSATVFQSEINLVTGRSSGEENYHFYLFINLFSCHARSSVFFPLPSRYVSSLILPKQYRTLTNLLQFRLRLKNLNTTH